MTEFLPCLYAALLIGLGAFAAAAAGYVAGRMREQLALLEMLRPVA